MRSRYFWNEGRVWKRQPLAVTASSTPRSFHASRNSSSSLRRVSAPTSSSNIFFSSEIGTGCCAASSAASSTVFTSPGLSMGEFHVDGGVRLGLRDLEQALPRELQHREEIDDQHRHAARGLEQVAELGEAAAPQPAQDEAHVLAHRQLLARDAVVLAHLRPDEKRAPCLLQIHDVDPGQTLRERLLDPHLQGKKIPPELRQGVELLRGELHLLVLEQAPHQLRTRVLFFLTRHRRLRQQHARLDLHQ